MPSAYLSEKKLFEEQNYSIQPTKSSCYSNVKFQEPPNNFKTNTTELPFKESFEPFDFLAIGTFGAELPNTDPPTPKLPKNCENLTSQQSQATENDLELMSYKLEKFLEASEEDITQGTSERSSQASIITLSSKPTEEADSEGHTCLVTCTLQNYVSAKANEQAETYKQVKTERTSLKELFKRSDAVHTGHTGNCEVAEKQHRKKNADNVMKKVLKKFHSSSSSTTVKSDAAVSISIKKKLFKVGLLFLHSLRAGQLNNGPFSVSVKVSLCL